MDGLVHVVNADPHDHGQRDDARQPHHARGEIDRHLGDVQVRLLNDDPWLRHRSTQRVVQHRQLHSGQLQAAANEQQHQEEHHKELHGRHHAAGKQASCPFGADA